MATYKIIGADQKEYGPVTAEQLRQWLAEGRLDGQTRVQSEGSSDWKALSEFPEFANAPGVGPSAAALLGAAPPPSPAGTGRNIALQAVKGPAIALMVTGLLNLMLALWSLVKLTVLRSSLDVYSSMPQFNDPQMQSLLHLASGPIGIVNAFFSLAMSVLVLAGAWRMQTLRNYTLAFVASILAMLPCVTPCCFLGLPFGIWALVVLNRPEVKSQFS